MRAVANYYLTTAPLWPLIIWFNYNSQFRGTNMGVDIVLIFFIALILIAIVGVLIAFISVKRTFKRLFGTSNILQLADMRETEMEETPKSISGMESIVRPQISEDFPTMSVDELKSRNADEIFAYYNALESGDISRYKNIKQVDDMLHKTAKEYEKQDTHISGVKIHKHAISRYNKNDENATINFQAAVEYIKKSKVEKDGKKTQVRVKTSWVYLPLESNFNAQGSFAANCPNCGAPMKSLGEKVCHYCHSNIEVDFGRAWVLSSIIEG